MRCDPCQTFKKENVGAKRKLRVPRSARDAEFRAFRDSYRSRLPLALVLAEGHFSSIKAGAHPLAIDALSSRQSSLVEQGVPKPFGILVLGGRDSGPSRSCGCRPSLRVPVVRNCEPQGLTQLRASVRSAERHLAGRPRSRRGSSRARSRWGECRWPHASERGCSRRSKRGR